MSKMKSYAESVLFQSIISLSGGPCSPDSLACLSERYISRLGNSDVPVPLRKELNDVKALLKTLIEKNTRDTEGVNQNQRLLTLITELYTDVVAWNAVEQYISASQFLLFVEEQNPSLGHAHNVMN